MSYWIEIWGPNSSDSIAIRYGLGVRGSNAGRGEILRTRPDRSWGLPRLIYSMFGKLLCTSATVESS